MPIALSDADKVIRNDTGKEIADAIRDLAAPEADKVAYDNTSSGLTADNAQDAIDELASEKMEKVHPTGTGALSLNRKANTTVGGQSVTLGMNGTASGDQSVAEGHSTVASGNQSHAEGHLSTSSGLRSHAEGYNTTASGDYSHSEGAGTTASGHYSHTENSTTVASGQTSHAEGYGTEANHRSQHVFGEWNELDASTQPATAKGNYVEIVGKGTSAANRSNARTLDWNGNETLAGDLKINGDQSLSTLWTTLSGLTVLSGKSGSIASFSTDIADKLFSCYVNVTAVQAGSGTPAPDNVRVISGWSACNLTGCGKNLVSGKITGANISEVGLIIANADFNMNYAFVKKGVTYAVNLSSLIGGYFSSIPTVGSQALNSSRIIISANSFTAEYDGYFVFRSDSTVTNAILNVGSTPITYEAYNGTTHNIPFNTTVYGGVLDVLSGVLTVTHEKIVLDGTQELFLTNWRPQTNSIGWYYKYNVSNNKPVPSSEIPNLICDKYPAQSYGALYAQDVVGVGVYNTDYAGLFVRVADTSLTTASAVNTWLASNPITVVYELATPTVIQLTPTEVKTILGQNNIFADCGDIDLKYLETIGNRLT